MTLEHDEDGFPICPDCSMSIPYRACGPRGTKLSPTAADAMEQIVVAAHKKLGSCLVEGE